MESRYSFQKHNCRVARPRGRLLVQVEDVVVKYSAPDEAIFVDGQPGRRQIVELCMLLKLKCREWDAKRLQSGPAPLATVRSGVTGPASSSRSTGSSP